jgi:hypothetical protein
VLHGFGDSGNPLPDKPSAARKKASKISNLYGFNAATRNLRSTVSHPEMASFSRCTTNRIKKHLTTIVTAYSRSAKMLSYAPMQTSHA